MNHQPSCPDHERTSPHRHEVVKQQLIKHLEVVVRERDPYMARGGHFLVREYIRKQLAQWGTVDVHEFQWRKSGHQNLILKIPGDPQKTSTTRRTSNAPILIGAHYDGVVGTPGADDNGTGVAVLLELAKQLTQQPIPGQEVWLVAFDLEEYGLLGSQAYAQELKRQQQPLKLMMSLEMLGYCDRTPGSQQYPSIFLKLFHPNQGDFITLVGNIKMIPELHRMTSTMRRSGIPTEWIPAGLKGHIVPDTRLSDHAPFWDEGYKALMVTDTSFLRNPHYHKKSDRIDTLDLDFLTRVYIGLEQAIRQLW